MTKIKMCGFVAAENACMAVEAGVDVIGLNFWRKSKRYIDEQGAKSIIDAVKGTNPAVIVMGLFVNEKVSEVERISGSIGIDMLQFHGEESPDYVSQFSFPCMKAVSLCSETDLERVQEFSCEWILVDTPSAERGGSGKVGDWNLAQKARKRFPKMWLAGGLDAANVGLAIRKIQPFGVDVASGVEIHPGYKDRSKVIDFIQAVRGAL